MAQTSQLTLYNAALRLVEEPKLLNLTEDREARYLLDDIWDNGAVQYCLEAGQWFFARRTVQIDYDPELQPAFGYKCAFGKPTDWVRQMGMWTDPYQNQPLTRALDEAGFWYADPQTIYVAYVSNDPQWGLNMALWPETFADFVAHYIAKKAKKLHSDEAMTEMLAGKDGDGGWYKKAKMIALATAAMNENTKFFPPGSWRRARWGRLAGYDRGNTNSFYG